MLIHYNENGILHRYICQSEVMRALHALCSIMLSWIKAWIIYMIQGMKYSSRLISGGWVGLGIKFRCSSITYELFI